MQPTSFVGFHPGCWKAENVGSCWFGNARPRHTRSLFFLQTRAAVFSQSRGPIKNLVIHESALISVSGWKSSCWQISLRLPVSNAATPNSLSFSLFLRASDRNYGPPTHCQGPMRPHICVSSLFHSKLTLRALNVIFIQIFYKNSTFLHLLKTWCWDLKNDSRSYFY